MGKPGKFRGDRPSGELSVSNGHPFPDFSLGRGPAASGLPQKGGEVPLTGIDYEVIE